MAQEKRKPDSKIEVPTRKPQKPGIFANIGANRSSGSHPVREILDFPAERPVELPAERSDELGAQTQHLDAQPEHSTTPNLRDVGRPTGTMLDAQPVQTRTPNAESLGRPDVNPLDAQPPELRTSDIATERRPKTGTLDAKAPEQPVRAPKTGKADGAKAPNSESLGAQTSSRWSIYEHNRKTDRLALRPNAEILKKFKRFCIDHDYTLTEFFELSGMRFLELGAQMLDESGAKAPLDDGRLKILYKTRPSIINLYLAYTARFNEHMSNSAGKWSGKWLPRDDEAAATFNETDTRMIELGIIQTQVNKGLGNGKIQTFKYYIDEIRSVMDADLNDNTLTVMTEHHRSTLARWFAKEIDLSFLDDGE